MRCLTMSSVGSSGRRLAVREIAGSGLRAARRTVTRRTPGGERAWVWFYALDAGWGVGFDFVGVCILPGVFVCFLRWHPRYVSVLQASPLCGAAPTFLCRRKEK